MIEIILLFWGMAVLEFEIRLPSYIHDTQTNRQWSYYLFIRLCIYVSGMETLCRL